MELSKKEFLDILEEKKACPKAVEWVKESKTETFIELWDTCERADWMLWILARMIKEKGWPSRKTVVLCACDCAETSLRFVPENELRPKIAIQTARKWAEGKASEIECAKAADDAYVSYIYAAAAADAASAAANAAASDAAHASFAASFAASSAVSYAVSYAASSRKRGNTFASVKKEALKNMAGIIRKRVTFKKVKR
jgi:hypothetical protein